MEKDTMNSDETSKTQPRKEDSEVEERREPESEEQGRSGIQGAGTG